mgnify:CR=1 FL=1
MMRMLLEIVMVLAIMGGLIFVTKVLAKEERADKAKSAGGGAADEAAEKPETKDE